MCRAVYPTALCGDIEELNMLCVINKIVPKRGYLQHGWEERRIAGFHRCSDC